MSKDCKTFFGSCSATGLGSDRLGQRARTPQPAKAAPVAAVVPAGIGSEPCKGCPFFKKAAESLGAQIWHVDEGFNPAAVPAVVAEVEESEPEGEPALDPDEV